MALGIEFFGLLALATAWVIETLHTLRTGKNYADPVMMFFFLLGGLIFAFASFQYNEPAYIAMNLSIVFLAFVNFVYIPHKLSSARKELGNARRKLSRA